MMIGVNRILGGRQTRGILWRGGSPLITLTGVSKEFFGQQKVLDHVELDLKRGEFVYVVGGSGAGKSTLLRMLATEEAPTLGAVKLFGYDLGRVSPSTLRAIRRAIGYVPQSVRLISDLTVQENVALSLSLAGRRARGRDARVRVAEVLEKLGLRAKQDRLASTLSGGEAQRVAVARALIRAPELIVADEPTGAQDRQFTWSLMDLFVGANQRGATVVIATHDLEIVGRVRRRCAVLKSGHLRMEGHLEAGCT